MSVFDLYNTGDKVLEDIKAGRIKAIRFDELQPPWWEPLIPYSPLLMVALVVALWVYMNRKQLFTPERTPRALGRALGRSTSSILIRPLTTPTKRAGAVLLVLGLAVSLVGIAQVHQYGRAAELWIEAIVFDYGWRSFWAVPIGALMTVAGALLAYFYDSTVGRVMRWIQTGSATP